MSHAAGSGHQPSVRLYEIWYRDHLQGYIAATSARAVALYMNATFFEEDLFGNGTEQQRTARLNAILGSQGTKKGRWVDRGIIHDEEIATLSRFGIINKVVDEIDFVVPKPVYYNLGHTEDMFEERYYTIRVYDGDYNHIGYLDGTVVKQFPRIQSCHLHTPHGEKRSHEEAVGFGLIRRDPEQPAVGGEHE